MTVCIGALCADLEGKPSGAAVVASDRMVTLGGIIEFEHEVPKVSSIADRVVILTAGDALRGARLVRELRDTLPMTAVTIDAVATGAAALYVAHRRQQIEIDIFVPRGLTMQQYYQGVNILPQILGSIDNDMMKFNYVTEFLIAGSDDTGAHLYHLGNPGGTTNNFETIGFTAIGSGQLAAIQSMIGFAHTPARGLLDTIFAVYASKKRAEAAPGVGHDTDMIVVHPGGRTHLGATVLEGLEELYQDYQRPVSQELKQKVSELDIFAGGGEQGGQT